jgi:catechol 2,3-dioxygenase-like lactoylglutathione lyase family enzyme
MRQPAIVRLMIGVLCAGALWLIVLILSGSGIDETSGRVIWTAVAVAFFSLTGITGTNLVQRRPRLAAFGYLTAMVSLVAFLTMAGSIWSDRVAGDDWKPAVYTLILAFAGGHASVLLAAAAERDSENIRLVRAGTILALALLVIMGCIEISSPGQDVGAQAIAVVAVLYVLGTISLALLRRVTPPAPGNTAGAPSAPAQSPGVLKLDHLVIAVTDLEYSTAFYENVLGATVVSLPGDRIAYRIGGQQLNVHSPGTAAAAPRAADSVRPGNSDLCFIWDGPVATMLEHLRARGVAIVEGPVEQVGAHGPGHSVYFRDPDGSLLELISYQG